MDDDPIPAMQPEEPPQDLDSSGSVARTVGCIVVPGLLAVALLWVLGTVANFVFGHWSYG